MAAVMDLIWKKGILLWNCNRSLWIIVLELGSRTEFILLGSGKVVESSLFVGRPNNSLSNTVSLEEAAQPLAFVLPPTKDAFRYVSPIRWPRH